jgi:hypothetical protein
LILSSHFFTDFAYWQIKEAVQTDGLFQFSFELVF